MNNVICTLHSSFSYSFKMFISLSCTEVLEFLLIKIRTVETYLLLHNDLSPKMFSFYFITGRRQEAIDAVVKKNH